MRDFTLEAYKLLLTELRINEYEFKTFMDYIKEKPEKEKLIILRHDVDKKPLRSLRTAELENELGIKGTYYFRVNKGKLPNEVIERVALMGHEIGYHYDDLHDACGDGEKALALFQNNLAALRKLATVRTACMHGSPMSRHDNRDLWIAANYRDFGIIGEPYFDIDFSKVQYLTDTGRRWDGDKVSIRDKSPGREYCPEMDGAAGAGGEAISGSQALRLHSTREVIRAVRRNALAEQLMLTVHPQRWNDQWLPWIWELAWQNVKNVVKYFVANDA